MKTKALSCTVSEKLAQGVLDFLTNFKIVEFSEVVISKTTEIWKDKDFEDAWQVGCVLKSKVNKVLRLDKKMHTKYFQY